MHRYISDLILRQGLPHYLTITRGPGTAGARIQDMGTQGGPGQAQDLSWFAPRYIELRNQLAAEIRAGRPGTHEQIPSISELMRRYGVSDGTVKRALRDLQQAGLIYTIPGKGCFVSDVAANPKPAPGNRAVGLVYGQEVSEVVDNLFFASLLPGLEQELCRHGLGLELINLRAFPLPSLLEARRAGALQAVLVYSRIPTDEMSELVAAGPSTVSLFVEYPPIRGLTCVVLDELEASRTATRHLIERGCRNIGAIQVSLNVSYAQLRLRAFREAIEEEFGAVDDSCVEDGNWTLDSGYLAMKRLLERHPEIDGVVAANDYMAIGAITAVLEAGRRVPEDIKVIGYDDIELAAVFRPSLTTMSVEREAVGRRAARTLLRKLEAPDQEFIIERSLPALVPRQSTGRSGQQSQRRRASK